MKTPIRKFLNSSSFLNEHIKDGLQAVKSDCIHQEIKKSFSDSVDIDEAFKGCNDGKKRWDYLLGHTESKKVFGLEPHPANDGEIKTVIEKRNNSRKLLKEHLTSTVSEWFWASSGRVDFTSMDKAKYQLDSNGIKFVGKKLTKKDIKKV